jgi:hypothetical protein
MSNSEEKIPYSKLSLVRRIRNQKIHWLNCVNPHVKWMVTMPILNGSLYVLKQPKKLRTCALGLEIILPPTHEPRLS